MKSANAFNPFHGDVHHQHGVAGGGSSVSSSFLDTSFNTSIDSSAYRFPATSHSTDFSTHGGEDDTFMSDQWLVESDGSDFDGSSSRGGGGETRVDISLHEEMTCRFDEMSNTSSLTIVGKVKVKSSAMEAGSSFDLVLDDEEGHIASIDLDTTWVTDTTDSYSNLEKGEHIYRIQMPPPQESKSQVATYTCCKSLRRIPLLVQSRVRNAGQYIRVGIKLRANPSNASTLTNMAVIMAVPPSMNGDTVKLSKKGAVWDSLKRIIVWPVQPIKNGESEEVQAQFEFEEYGGGGGGGGGEGNRDIPSFPVLVRCHALDDQLSSVKFGVTDTDNLDVAFRMNLVRSYCVLHRKS